MRNSDVLWVRNLARRSCGQPPTKNIPTQVINQAVHIFLDELCALMTDYSNYFNELVQEAYPQNCFRVFKLSHPRPGLMLLRGKDKLVIAGEGTRIRARIVQVHAYQERSLDVIDFDAYITPDEDVVWMCSQDSQRVSPEMVAKHYLGAFLAFGCRAFEEKQVVNRSQSVKDTLEF